MNLPFVIQKVFELLPKYIKTAFTRCPHTLKNVMNRPSVHTKTAISLPADFENGGFRKRSSKRQILEMALFEHSKMMATEHFSTLFERNSSILKMEVLFSGIKVLQRFSGQISYSLKSFPHRVNASSNFATVTSFIVFKKICRHCVNASLELQLKNSYKPGFSRIS